MWRLLILAVALVLALLIAMGESGRWDLILRFIYQAPFGRNDPLFDKDIGFYLFSLPLYVALKNWLLWILLLATLIAGAIYFVHGDISFDTRPWTFLAPRNRPWLRAARSLLRGARPGLTRWTATSCSTTTMASSSEPATPMFMSSCRRSGCSLALPPLPPLSRGPTCGCARTALSSQRLCWCSAGRSFFAEVAPALFERFYVKPSELQLERPYIQRNIAFTREAYNLGQIAVKPFPAEQDLTFQSLKDNSGTVNNIRLWDWQPLMDTYAQLQEIRTYYRFLDVDVDRYHLDDSYQQVMLSARELDPSLLSANAQTWVNLHLLFTHGNGVVMSPVTQKSAEGLPIFYLKDIPPVAASGPRITEPRIYFGQGAAGYVIVKGGTPEFDYPKGTDNVYANYDGADGIPIGGTAWRSLFAWNFG